MTALGWMVAVSFLWRQDSLFRYSNSLFRSEIFPVLDVQGICLQLIGYISNFARKVFPKGAKRQNSLLISLFCFCEPQNNCPFLLPNSRTIFAALQEANAC